MPFHVRQLRYALAAARYGSFQRAAKSIGIEESSLSRQIRNLERSLGAPLFHRSRAGVRPTLAGQQFLHGAEHVLNQSERITEAMRAVGQGSAGRLAIGFYASLSSGNLRATLFDFDDRYPEIDIAKFEESRDELLAGLYVGLIDIVFLSGEATYPGLTRLSLWSDRLFVALPASHPFTARDVIYWPDLRQETFLVGKDGGDDVRDVLVMQLSLPGQRPTIRQHRASRESLLSEVSGGRGVTLLCESALGLRVADVVMREVHNGHGPAQLSTSAYWREDNDDPPLRRFLDFVKNRYSLNGVGH